VILIFNFILLQKMTRLTISSNQTSHDIKRTNNVRNYSFNIH